MKPISIERLAADHLQTPRFFQLVTDHEGRVITANGLFRKKFAVGQAISPDNCFIESIPPSHKNDFQGALKNCLHYKQTATVELKHRLPDTDCYFIYWEVAECGMTMDRLQWIGQHVPAKLDRNATAAQAEQGELFRALVADSLDGVLLVDESGLISFASKSVSTILGFLAEEIVGRNAFQFVHPEDMELAYGAFMDEVDQVAERKFIGIRLLEKSGEWRWCMVRGHNQLANPNVGKMLIYFCDDNYRRNIESALIESRERFMQLIQNLNIGIILADPAGSILLINQACRDIFQFDGNELVGDSVFNPDYVVANEAGVQLRPEEYPFVRAIQTKTVVKNHILSVRLKGDNNETWIQLDLQPILTSDGQLKNVICSFIDITEQRKLSQQLAFQEQQRQKQLMQATIDGQERERSEISRELHDNISQHLTTTRLYLEVARDKASDQVGDMITQAHKSLIHVSQEIRTLCQSLAPPELTNIGLVESIQDLCDKLRSVHPYVVEFDHSHFEECRLPDNMKLMFFRIIQEQVNNIIRHSGAEIIGISLNTDNERVVLLIGDNGVGFDANLVKKGLGLTNMLNRVSIFDGKTEIVTSPGQGCRLHVTVPLNG